MNRKLYAYLNIDHPMVAWEVAIGRIKTICHNNSDGFGVSLWQYALLEKYLDSSQSNKVFNEFKLEQVRQQMFPDCVSRLQGVYFFETREMANIALDRWGMTNKKKYISEINFFGNNYTELDSEWITTYLDSEFDGDRLWMESYWAGEKLGVNPLTEIIASGIGLVVDNNLRKLAYDRIMKKWPDSTVLLSSCCYAFSMGEMEEVGLSKAALVNNDGAIHGAFYISMNDFNKNESGIVKCIEQGRQQGVVFPYTSPSNPEIIFSLPDLSPLSLDFSEAELVDAFKSVHM
ncbi:hypothetical protein [Moritella sp. 28]|uniref:hypothetical protein n=1 Tax=Moritella sp. 28 TaxID=2746232 RepID=UPI001BA84743|nr:hypothetical protein [Moritella sp. 28]QUM84440.1 hypothetical protein HWV02_07935 [Moritella sp. 28]